MSQNAPIAFPEFVVKKGEKFTATFSKVTRTFCTVGYGVGGPALLGFLVRILALAVLLIRRNASLFVAFLTISIDPSRLSPYTQD